ncbi:MAG: class I SAM-dependent methyltransferase [Synechococcales cyanobacterium]
MSFDFSTAADSNKNPLIYFSDRGEDYEKYRPIYPVSVIDTILSRLGSSSQISAADIGAGTGIGSRLLADRGIQVKAIEPNEDMRAAAPLHANVEYVAGTAEQIPLKTASVDLVTPFQAFHWFEFNKSLREFHRILKPGGCLALAWSFWDQDNLVSKEYSHLVLEASKDQEPQPRSGWSFKTWLKGIRYQLFWHGLLLPCFTNVQRHTFYSEQTLDFSGLIGLALSQGFTPSAGIGLEKLRTDLAMFYQRVCNPQGLVNLMYCTYLYTATPKHP